MTLLDIYNLYEQEKYEAFAQSVAEYGASDFARDIGSDENGEGEPVNTPQECYDLLACYIVFNEKQTGESPRA